MHFVNIDEIKQIVLANNGFNPRIFGSVLHGNHTEESDLDLLFDPKTEMQLATEAAEGVLTYQDGKYDWQENPD